MPKKKMIIPPAAMVELIKKAGAERVSEQAAKALAEYLIDIGFEIAQESIKLARHAGRKTVKKADIELAKTRV
jgi:histone H3/H4